MANQFHKFNSLGYQVIGVSPKGAIVCWECIPVDKDYNPLEGFEIKGYPEGDTLICDCCSNDITSDYGVID